MPQRPNWIWVERIFGNISKFNYKVISALPGVLVFIIYILFINTNKIIYLPWDTYTIVIAFALSSLITIQLAGINYFMENIKISFKILGRIYMITEDIFLKSKKLYILIVIILFSVFTFLDFKHGMFFPAFINNYCIWYKLFDIYNFIVVYFMLTLLAVNVWIILNISSVFNNLKNIHSDIYLEIDLYNPDRIGGLSPIRTFIKNYLIYYFICISLAIISYISPFDQFNTYYTIVLVSLLLLGLYLLFIGMRFICRVLTDRVKCEIDIVNKRQEYYKNNITKIESEKNCTKDLICMSILLSNLYNERNLIDTINRNGFDFITFAYIFVSLISPILSATLSVILSLPDGTINALISTYLW